MTEPFRTDPFAGADGAEALPSTVLFLAANPERLPHIQSGEECRAIETKIRMAKFRDHLRLRPHWAAQPDDLLQGLNEHAPMVLHFSGHGGGEPGLCFQSEDGGMATVNAEALDQIMRAAGSTVKLVVLNACYSEVQAQAIVAHIPCVVGMTGAIGDEAATIYAASLYRALAFGHPVANAHQQGLAALALHAGTGRRRDLVQAAKALPPALPTLLTRPGVDANRLCIVQSRPWRPRRRWLALAPWLLFVVTAATTTAIALVAWTPATPPPGGASRADAAEPAQPSAPPPVDAGGVAPAVGGLERCGNHRCDEGETRQSCPRDCSGTGSSSTPSNRGPCVRLPGDAIKHERSNCPLLSPQDPDWDAIKSDQRPYECSEIRDCKKHRPRDT